MIKENFANNWFEVALHDPSNKKPKKPKQEEELEETKEPKPKPKPKAKKTGPENSLVAETKNRYTNLMQGTVQIK